MCSSESNQFREDVHSYVRVSFSVVEDGDDDDDDDDDDEDDDDEDDDDEDEDDDDEEDDDDDDDDDGDDNGNELAIDPALDTFRHTIPISPFDVNIPVSHNASKSE